MPNLLKLNNVVIYKLKRLFGLPLIVYKSVENTMNVETGRVIREWVHHHVRRAVILPHEIARSFVYDLSYIAANKNFTYGATFDKDTRIVLIDRKDLKGFVIVKDCWLNITDIRYEIVDLMDVEELSSYMLKVKATTGNLPVEHITPSPGPSSNVS